MDKPVLNSLEIKSKCVDKKDNLSNYDLIFLSASSGIGKTHYLSQSQVLRFSHRIILNLTSLHNDVNNFWNELFTACADAGWIKTGAVNLQTFGISNQVSRLETIRGLSKELNKYSGQYTQQDNLYLIFDNAHLIVSSDVIAEIVYFAQQLNSSIKCVFSGRDHYLYTVFKDSSGKKIRCLKEHDFLLNQAEFNEIISFKFETLFSDSFGVNTRPEKNKTENSKAEKNCKIKLTSLINALYQLVGGHVGLAMRCLETDVARSLMADNTVFSVDAKRFALQAIQSEELHVYFKTLTKPLLNLEWKVLALPRLNRALITHVNRAFKLDNDLEFYLGHGLFNSIDRVSFSAKPLFRYWLDLNVNAIDESLSLLAIDQYRNNDDWQEAIHCAITLENWPLTIELVCQAARFFSQRGQYLQARELINQLPKNKQQPLILSLFENLLDFQQYGHQVAHNHLHVLIAEHQSNLNCDVNSDQKQVDKRSLELIALLQHHYTYLLAPSQKHETHLDITDYPQLFSRDHEFSTWAWHSLAMEQILAGSYSTGLESLLKAIHWSMQIGDAPCALASLAWIVVPCLQQGKLSFGLEYCNKVESWLQENQLHNISMVSTLHRVRIILLREQGHLELAEHELHLMQYFYPNLDPLNLAYCYWAEFLLLLAQKNYDKARQQLSILEGHAAAHFDGWQLALPKPALLSAVLDTLAGSELAMLNWASQFQLTHIDNDDVWLKATDITVQSEVIAYVRIRITLGSDMSLACDQLIEQAELKQDCLLALHGLILKVLNASRQGDELSLTHYRHLLLNRAGTLEFHQVYKEYLDELLPLLLNYQVLPSELTGYEKIVPSSAIAVKVKVLEAIPQQHQVINESELFASLTQREQQICLLVIEGLSNKEIAIHSAISLATVKGHVSNIYNKLGIKRRGQLANAFSHHQ